LLELTTKRSNFWYILPIILGFLGGILAAIIIRKSDPKKALICVIVGTGITALWFALVFSTGDQTDSFESDDVDIAAQIKKDQEMDSLKQEVAELKEQVNELQQSPKIVPDEELKRQRELEEAEYQAELEARYQRELERERELEQPSDDKLDPALVASAKKNIPDMQSLPQEILKQCKNVKSLSDFITLGLAVEIMMDELLASMELNNALITSLEVNGYDKHPEVGPLIKKYRSITFEMTECMDEITRRYG